ncbi:acetylcholine-gated cation-selective channel [Aureococcus anophagefferens]|nr:acetylcholine-gated cation-selective channel [Aureococcus anophagefferens]
MSSLRLALKLSAAEATVPSVAPSGGTPMKEKAAAPKAPAQAKPAPEPASTEVPKRKRGRPPKAPAKETPEKKTRGRPKQAPKTPAKAKKAPGAKEAPEKKKKKAPAKAPAAKKRGTPEEASEESSPAETEARRPSRACKQAMSIVEDEEAAADGAEVLSALGDLVEKKGGDREAVVDGWAVRARVRPGDGRVEHVYVDPAGKRHRSRNEVLRCLGLLAPTPAKRARDEAAGAPEAAGDPAPPAAPPPEKRPRAKNPDIDLAAFGWAPPPPPDFAGMLERLRAVDVPRTLARQNIIGEADASAGVRSACVGVVAARSHGVMASSFARSRPGLTRELVRFGKAHLPASFKFTSIQLNHNFSSELHVDDYNAGPSYICGLGTYSGGELWTLEHGPLDCKQSFRPYDGTEPHATLPFAGTRYTLIFFCHQTHPHLREEDRAYLLSARAAGDACYEAWRLEDAREATPDQRAIQGRVFEDEGTRWRVRDADRRGVYYDLELKRLCVEYYDFDAPRLRRPGSGDDVVEFTPYDEFVTFATWVDGDDAPDAPELDGDARETARAEAARRLDAKRAFEAADDAMDYLLDLDKDAAKNAAAAAKAALSKQKRGPLLSISFAPS